jgi:hypothetical protein
MSLVLNKAITAGQDGMPLNAEAVEAFVHKFMPAASSELVDALVKMCAWSEEASVATVGELRDLLCTLCSYRNLQKRLQIWFRAVPGMYDSVVSAVLQCSGRDESDNEDVTTTADVFCEACQIANIPLSLSESFMLSQLLTRKTKKGDGRAVRSSQSELNREGWHVDVKLLLQIKDGEFLSAMLGFKV